jgi:glycine cleavage system aminomethyltransferase T
VLTAKSGAGSSVPGVSLEISARSRRPAMVDVVVEAPATGSPSLPAPLLFHAEIIHRDGRPVGYIRAASYGHTLGGAVGLAMIDAGDAALDQKWIDAGTWEVDIAGRRYPAVASLRPLYDPTNERIKR